MPLHKMLQAVHLEGEQGLPPQEDRETGRARNMVIDGVNAEIPMPIVLKNAALATVEAVLGFLRVLPEVLARDVNVSVIRPVEKPE